MLPKTARKSFRHSVEAQHRNHPSSICHQRAAPLNGSVDTSRIGSDAALFHFEPQWVLSVDSYAKEIGFVSKLRQKAVLKTYFVSLMQSYSFAFNFYLFKKNFNDESDEYFCFILFSSDVEVNYVTQLLETCVKTILFFVRVCDSHNRFFN